MPKYKYFNIYVGIMSSNSKTRTTHRPCSLCSQRTHHASIYSIENNDYCPDCVTLSSCEDCGCDITIAKNMINEGAICQDCYEQQKTQNYSILYGFVGLAIAGFALYRGISTGFNSGGGILFLFGLYMVFKGL